ncbi:MAG: LemA family protein [Lachnospiraceae bacterium]|jgi:LemA protein|nr:LemA family protein [Lachnospiraceae bacterium]
MKKSLIMVIGAVILIGIIISTFAGTYNSLVTKEEAANNKLADIDTMLQRRLDLIPNLVNTVKGFAAHETEIIDSVTEARTKLAGASTLEDKANANGELTTALNKLLVVVENYPQIQSSANFIQLSDELAGTENRIAVARKDYNDAVKDFNASIKKFPSNLMANMFGFESKEYFEASEGANSVPNVEF